MLSVKLEPLALVRNKSAVLVRDGKRTKRGRAHTRRKERQATGEKTILGRWYACSENNNLTVRKLHPSYE